MSRRLAAPPVAVGRCGRDMRLSTQWCCFSRVVSIVQRVTLLCICKLFYLNVSGISSEIIN